MGRSAARGMSAGSARCEPLEPIADAITDEGRDAKPTHLLLRGNLSRPARKCSRVLSPPLTGSEEKPAAITPPDKRNTTGTPRRPRQLDRRQETIP